MWAIFLTQVSVANYEGNGGSALLGSSALSVCPAIKAYISVTTSWILMKLGESVET